MEYPRRARAPSMTSLSTRFLGQPRLTNPTFGALFSGISYCVRLLARWTVVDALQVAVQDLDSSIEQRADREEPFLLSVDEMLGRPAGEEPEELIGDRVSPIAHLIGEFGFL